MEKNSFTIRSLHTAEELGMVRDLECLVWESDDPVPVHQTMTVVKHGGMVLGAFDAERLIGFQYSFAGFDGKKPYLCSHTLGIHPDYRKSGIGEQLKRVQREEALRIGYDLITWTYDPLETVNGNLNIRKLGAVCSKYIENCYGEMTDILNAGIPSDRFEVEWRIQSEHVSRRMQGDRNGQEDIVSFPQAVQLAVDDRGFAVPVDIDLRFDQPSGTLAVAVPANFQNVKVADMELALRWRLQTRAVFSHYFKQGWQVVQFVKSDGQAPAHYYLLQKSE
ncbi:GNAT family N-acetyltransferase [Brevibacillus sp. B_LB10_24]|uniref:GNAT family N-acetyltransferase n=1 Tax=Brevibacillus sp. B_LB10_24 TaxID=3380645 RepID=UPI0038B6F2B4